MLSKSIHQQAFINQSGSQFPHYLLGMIEHRIGMQFLQMVFNSIGLNELVCSFSQISLALLVKVRLKTLFLVIWFRTGKKQLLEPTLTNMYDAMSLRWRHDGPDSVSTVYSTVYSDADRRKHQSFASLAFAWGIHRRPGNSPHKWPVTRKMFPFDDVIMFCYYDTIGWHEVSVLIGYVWIDAEPMYIAQGK